MESKILKMGFIALTALTVVVFVLYIFLTKSDTLVPLSKIPRTDGDSIVSIDVIQEPSNNLTSSTARRFFAILEDGESIEIENPDNKQLERFEISPTGRFAVLIESSEGDETVTLRLLDTVSKRVYEIVTDDLSKKQGTGHTFYAASPSSITALGWNIADSVELLVVGRSNDENLSSTVRTADRRFVSSDVDTPWILNEQTVD